MDCRLIIDANLLVDHLVETGAAPTAQLVETLLQMSMEDKVTILLPELVIDIECSSTEGEKDYWRARHQDLMVWARKPKGEDGQAQAK
ncbi:MAG: hypothetical protein QW075_01160 [Thermofilaceae archaeon]